MHTVKTTNHAEPKVNFNSDALLLNNIELLYVYGKMS